MFSLTQDYKFPAALAEFLVFEYKFYNQSDVSYIIKFIKTGRRNRPSFWRNAKESKSPTNGWSDELLACIICFSEDWRIPGRLSNRCATLRCWRTHWQSGGAWHESVLLWIRLHYNWKNDVSRQKAIRSSTQSRHTRSSPSHRGSQSNLLWFSQRWWISSLHP